MRDKVNHKDPLVAIDKDIHDLVKKCGILKYELDDQKNKKESEVKSILLSLIEAVDAFENIFKNIDPKLDTADKTVKIWILNFRSINKILIRLLKNNGVIPVKTIIGEKANPFWHNVFQVVEKPDFESEIIIEEIKKGYLWKGKLLRAAEIKAVK